MYIYIGKENSNHIYIYTVYPGKKTNASKKEFSYSYGLIFHDTWFCIVIVTIFVT